MKEYKLVDLSEYYRVEDITTSINRMINGGWELHTILEGCGRYTSASFNICVLFVRENQGE